MDVHVYFDYGSPFSYLAWQRIVNVHPKRYRGAEVLWKPVSAGHIFAADGSRPNVTYPNQKRYLDQDLRRWAARYKVPYAPPADGSPGEMPVRSIDASRLHVMAAQGGPEVEAAWMDAVFQAYFRDGRDISDLDVLQALADDVGLVVDVQEAVGRESLKRRLVANTQEAYAAGAPGVPFTTVADEAFWGNDRLDWVEDLLASR